jgi:hypothetical protein
MNFAEAALSGYLKELATHRRRHKKMTGFEARVTRVRLASLISARMIELNGAWDVFTDMRLTWAFEYCRFSEDGGPFRIPHEDAALYHITGDDIPAHYSTGRGSTNPESATA